MTTSSKSAISVATPVVLFGLDPHDKPQAGRFPARLCDLAIKAAQQLKLNVLKVTTADLAQIAGRLPVGRINSAGRGLVPYVRRPLYDQIAAMAKAGDPKAASATTTPANGSTGAPLNEMHTTGNSAGAPGLPASWKDIGPNHLVLVQQNLANGWWECIVVERTGDMLTVRWRDYPKWKPFPVHADAVALLNPSPSFKG